MVEEDIEIQDISETIHINILGTIAPRFIIQLEIIIEIIIENTEW
jgi:hypothetical protein